MMRSSRRPSWWPDYGLLLRQNGLWVTLAAVLFGLGFGGGFAAARSAPETVVAAMAPVMQQLEGLAAQVVAADDPFTRTWVIFANNIRVTTLVMVLGVGLGLVPVVVLLANGVLIGLILALATAPTAGSLPALARTSDPLLLAAATLPHGIIELSAVLLATAWGLKIGLAFLVPSAAGRRGIVWRAALRECVQIYAVVFVLLLLAAAIEGNITLLLVRALRG